ncbi:MAG: XRE family transcriptional regulator [Halanaerobium sp.]|nr:MAG: XRE family transcriptional regulator [Halanaerobium sp.]
MGILTSKLTFTEIGKRLKEARESSAFTQSEVEELTGINRVTISNIERGQKKIDSLLLKKLADLYGYSLMYFLEEPEEFEEISIAFRTDGLNDKEKENINWTKKLLFNFNDLQEIMKAGD